eukprot:1655978-Karenia_brevis.AAC.1
MGDPSLRSGIDHASSLGALHCKAAITRNGINNGTRTLLVQVLEFTAQAKKLHEQGDNDTSGASVGICRTS